MGDETLLATATKHLMIYDVDIKPEEIHGTLGDMRKREGSPIRLPGKWQEGMERYLDDLDGIK